MLKKKVKKKKKKRGGVGVGREGEGGGECGLELSVRNIVKITKNANTDA